MTAFLALGRAATVSCIVFVMCFASMSEAVVYVVSPLGQFPTTSESQSWIRSNSLASTLKSIRDGAIIYLCEGEEFAGPFVVVRVNITIKSYPCISGNAGIKPLITVSRAYQGLPIVNDSTGIWVYNLFTYKQYIGGPAGVMAVWINGIRYFPSRYPNLQDTAVPQGQNSTEFIFSNPRDLAIPISRTNYIAPSTPLKNMDSDYWVGAKLCIRETDFSYTTRSVTSVQNGRLIMDSNFTSSGTLRAPGFFIEHNRLAELDSAGEYFFDPVEYALYVLPMAGHLPTQEMRFLPRNTSSLIPAGDSIGAALTFNGAKGPNNTLDGIAFRYGISGVRTFQNTDLVGIDVRDMTDYGAHGDIRVLRSYFSDIGVAGARLLTPTSGGTDSTVSASTFRNIGVWAGYYNMPTAVRCYVTCRILDSTFDRMGYAAALPQGHFSVVRNNTMSNTMLTLSDGGAVYVGGTNGVEISGNAVVSIVGNTVSTQAVARLKKTTAFYLDGCAYNTTIAGNLLLSGYVKPDLGQTCVLLSNGSNTVAGNLFVGCRVDVALQDTCGVGTGNCTAVGIAIDRNRFVPTPNTQGPDILVQVRFSTSLRRWPSSATFRSVSYNTFCKTAPNSSSAAWRPMFIGLELNGPVLDLGMGNYTNISTNVVDTSGLCGGPLPLGSQTRRSVAKIGLPRSGPAAQRQLPQRSTKASSAALHHRRLTDQLL